jgi:PPE-repeat protein
MYWAVRYRTNLRLGLISDVCFLELVTFDPQNKIPLGVGGMFFVDPVFTMQSMAAGMTGAGKTPADLKAWLDSQPPPPGGVATAGFVSAFVVGLMGLANSLGGVPPVGSGRTTGRAIPAPLKEYMGQDWHWVYRNGKWVLVQGTFDAAGAWSTWGTPIAGSIFEVPDPSVFGDKINRFTTPVTGLDPQATAAKAVLADVMTTGLKDDLKPDRWATLSDAQRAEALAKVIRRLGPLTGVKGTSFAIRYGTTSNAGLEGEWSGRSRTLFINSRSRVVGDPRKMLSTALHELRHAGQEDYAADLGGGAEYRAKVTANDKTYAGSADYTRYAAQLSERDAEVFGETISKAVMDEVMKP